MTDVQLERNGFAGKVAIVTGGASGIGLAIVRRLHRSGALIVCADINASNLASIRSTFVDRLLCVETDVTVEASVESAMAAAVDHFGHLDMAFNVAGGTRSGYVADLNEADWNFTVDLCLKGVFLCVKHASRLMLPRRAGAIVNVTSINSHIPSHGGAAYSSAKAGAEMLTKNAALEFAQEGVRVNAVLPGLVETPLTNRLFQNKEMLNAFNTRIPVGRPGLPDEIADPALFLASDDARYITGVSLIVDGGWHLSSYPDMRPFR